MPVSTNMLNGNGRKKTGGKLLEKAGKWVFGTHTKPKWWSRLASLHVNEIICHTVRRTTSRTATETTSCNQW
jgi:hypothetical protein